MDDEPSHKRAKMTRDTVTLRSSDAKGIEVDVRTACMSETVKKLMEDSVELMGTEGGVPLPNVRSEILEKVLQYCEKHAGEAKDDDVEKFDKAFLAGMDQNTLFETISAANFLDIKGLLDLTCKAVADQIKGKTPEQIRTLYGIENDFTPEEEEEIRRENQWAFD